MSHDAASSCRAVAEHSVAAPGGTIYYRTQGSGPPLVLIGGGPSNADTLAALAGSDDRPEARREDIELFIHRDVPAIADYRLDLDHITPLADRIVITAGEDGRAFYPHRCAEALAAALGTPLIELPGNHAAMITHPAEFVARLEPLLP